MPLHAQDPERGSDDFPAIRPRFAWRGELQAMPPLDHPGGFRR